MFKMDSKVEIKTNVNFELLLKAFGIKDAKVRAHQLKNYLALDGECLLQEGHTKIFFKKLEGKLFFEINYFEK